MIHFPDLIVRTNNRPTVDLIITAKPGYTPGNPSRNGLENGFGNINVKMGTVADLNFRFVEKTELTQKVKIDKVSLAFYDLDEGKRGRGRTSIETCDGVHGFVTPTTELSQVRVKAAPSKERRCMKTTTCVRGGKTNDPSSPEAITDDHLKRALTYTFSDVRNFNVRLSSNAGHGSRNFKFNFDPLMLCAVTTTTTTVWSGSGAESEEVRARNAAQAQLRNFVPNECCTTDKPKWGVPCDKELSYEPTNDD